MTRRPKIESRVEKFYCVRSLEPSPGQHRSSGSCAAGETTWGSAPHWESALRGVSGCGSTGLAPVSAVLGVSPRDPGIHRVHTAVCRPGGPEKRCHTSLPAGSLDSDVQLKRSHFSQPGKDKRQPCLNVSGWLVSCLSNTVQGGWGSVLRTDR